MKKNKNIKALAFSLIGGLSSLTTLPLAAISCKENLDIVKGKVKLTVPEKYRKEHTVDEFIKEPSPEKILEVSGINSSKYEVSVLGIKKINDDKVEVNLEIKSKKTGNIVSQKFTISGFKKVVDHQKLINEELNKVTVSYKGTTPKENIEAKDVKKEDLEFSGFDKEKYEIDSITLNASESNNGILQPMVSLKTKDGKIKSTTKALKLDGFKKNVQEDEQDKINKLVNKIDNVDYENKENIEAKNANDSTKIKWEFKSGVTENKDDYEIANATFEPIETDLTKLKIKFYLKNKKNGLVSKSYITRILEGFKKPEITDPEQKKFNDYVEGLTAKYSESTDNLDLNELDLNKMKYSDKENHDIDSTYQISDVKWLKDKISKDEWENGKRKFSAKITKGTYSLVREFEITTHPSDKNVLIDQREKFKENTKLIHETDVKQLVDSMADGANLYYSYQDYKFYNKKYDKNNPNDPTRKAIFELKNHQAVFGTNMTFAKLVKKGNKISLKFKLAKYIGQGTPNLEDVKEIQTNEEEFDIYDQNRLNELADQNKDKFDYKNKENTKLIDIKENDIVKPSVPRCDVVISKVEKDSANNQLKVTYKLVYGSIVSKEVETTIKGFKEDALNSLLDGVTLEYENKENVFGTEANVDTFKLMKNNTEYNIPSDVTVKKEIISANKYKNIVKVKVTLTKGSETTYVEYEVSGFRKEAFDLDKFNDKLQFNYQGDIANTEASTVQYSQFKTENDGYPLDCAEIKDVKLEKNVEEGKVTIKYKLKDLCNDGNPEKEYSKEITGFKKTIVKNYKSKAVYEASVADKLFTVDNNKISQLREALAKLNTLVALKGGKVWTSNGNNGKVIPGISVHKEAISHGGKATVAKFKKWGKNTKGINIVKENSNYVAKWRLVLANGDIDKQEYSQVLCPIN